MKQTALAALAVAAIFTACSKDSALDGSPVKPVTFQVQGDFTLSQWSMENGQSSMVNGQSSMVNGQSTRALIADGKSMTDLWLFDYMDGALKQTIHQTSEDADFGSPTVTLAFGTHHIYAVASRGQSPVLDTEEEQIVWTKVLDTFWTDYAITVSASSSTTATITLDRMVTKLVINPNDLIPAGTARVDITPHTWYYGIDYKTGAPAAASEDEAVTISIPASKIGTTTYFNVFGLSAATEWNTDITVASYDDSDTETASVTIATAPFVRNRVTEYSGALWSVGSGLTLSLNTEWSTSYQGTW